MASRKYTDNPFISRKTVTRGKTTTTYSRDYKGRMVKTSTSPSFNSTGSYTKPTKGRKTKPTTSISGTELTPIQAIFGVGFSAVVTIALGIIATNLYKSHYYISMILFGLTALALIFTVFLYIGSKGELSQLFKSNDLE